MFKRFISGFLAAGLLALAQFADATSSSINPNVPAQNSLISSGPLRTNFLAAYNDINALIAQNSGVTPPLVPVLGQQWLNIGTIPYYLEEWDGAQWVILGGLNANTHQWVLTPCNANTGGGVPTPPNDPTQILRGDCTWATAAVGSVTSVSVATANGFAGTITNPTIAPTITLGTTATGILQGNGTAISGVSTTGTGSVVEANSPVITTPTINGLQYGSTSASVSAVGTTQGTATALTSAYNVVTTVAAGAGVILPTPSAAGASVSIVNKGANALLVYPNSGAAIDAGSANAAISLPVGAFYTAQNSSTTQWYTFDPAVVGTATQITVTNSPGTTTLSIPTNPTLGGANFTGIPINGAISGLGTGAATALGTNVGSAGAVVVNGGALGTPASGTLTNATGLPLATGVTGVLPVANGGTGLTTAPANGVLNIGNGSGYTRATLTAGTGISVTNGAGSIIIASSGPTVIPGYIHGFTLSNDATTPNYVIDVAAGSASDTTNVMMINGTAFTKQVSGTSCTGSSNAFAVGMGNCGLFGTAFAASTWYHVFAILCSGSFDVYFDTSITAENKPACATNYRYIGDFLSNSTPYIYPFAQIGQKIITFGSTVVNGGSATTPTAVTVQTPPGVNTIALLRTAVTQTAIATSDGLFGYIFYSSSLGYITECASNASVANVQVTGTCQITTNTSSQIYYAVGVSTTTATIFSYGYINPYLSPNL